MQAKYVGLDELHWLPDWKGRTDEELFPLLKEELSCDSWVLDGNYKRTEKIKWSEVDLVVWVDLPFWRTFKQVLWRSIKRAISGKVLWPGTGNIETFRRTFLTKDSIIWWMITTYSKNKRVYEEEMRNAHKRPFPFIRLTSPEEVKSFIDSF